MTTTTKDLHVYTIHARLPLTNTARNAGATGRKWWWVMVGTALATSAKAACAAHRKSGQFAYADRLRAVSR